MKWTLVTTIFLVLSQMALTQEECVAPKVAARSQCGIVTDLNGEPIEGAKVAAMWADVGSSTKTNAKGEWGFLSTGKRQGWILIDAKGFQPLHFDYTTSNNSSPICQKPIYIRLAPGGGVCKSAATLNPQKGIFTKR